jgi:hypothetical protein
VRTVRQGLQILIRSAAIAIIALSPCSAPLPLWQIYTFCDGSFAPLTSSPLPHSHTPISPPLPPTPTTWHIAAAVLADATNDGIPEWALLVWRPWRDWPIQRWSSVPSPIAGFHDAAGESCHLILLDPQDGHEIWAGSALPVPLLALAVGDVDGDGRNEVVTLEGDYAAGRDGPATRVDVWRWNGFGFTLEWRSTSGTFHQLRLTDANNDGILDVAIR